MSCEALEETNNRYFSLFSSNSTDKEGQTTQWPKENGQKDKQRSTKHTSNTNPTKNRVWTQVLRKET
jgi:hypothetical protein